MSTTGVFTLIFFISSNPAEIEWGGAVGGGASRRPDHKRRLARRASAAFAAADARIG
jgi:hypothetical protein